MSNHFANAIRQQRERNRSLLDGCTYLKDEVTSRALPLYIDIARETALSADQSAGLEAIGIDAARIALSALASLARINELDHLGGALDLIPALTMTLSFMDYERTEFTIENAHTSIGYYAALAARGFLDRDQVIEGFRRGLDIPGHVSWVPGGTQLNGGRLGVMIPVAAGQALGKKALYGEGSWVVCHCGDAGWISGQALNGFNAADLHGAPLTFVMHRNGVQLSAATKTIMDKDPRPVIAALGIEIIETPTLHDPITLYKAYRTAHELAQRGRPSLIYPTGFRSTQDSFVDLNYFGSKYGIHAETQVFATRHKVSMETEVWIPGALMSFRDVEPMLECLFLVNELPGGAGHHDGHMKGRDLDAVLGNPMLQFTDEQQAALDALRAAPPRAFVTRARPAPGSANLEISDETAAAAKLPEVGKNVSPRSGVQEAYAAVAKAHPERVFIVGCDLDPSTKLGKARTFIPANHYFEMSIEEQAACLLTNGLAMAAPGPQLNAVSTFAAFFEGIAREGMEMWRYQRNLNGVNEGLNVIFHMSHVGACTGRDHFSGWALDWVNLGLGYLPYLQGFYGPADAGAAFVAIRHAASKYGAHLVGIPRDNLPVLAKPDGSGPLYGATDAYEPLTAFRTHAGATQAIIAFGAPAFLAGEVADRLQVDAFILNGFPLGKGQLAGLLEKYPDGVVTIEDGLIGTPETGIQGVAGVVAGVAGLVGVPVAHIGIVDPRIAPSDGHLEVWEHFGITAEALAEAVQAL